MATRPQIAMIHTLKSKIGMDDCDYRAMLEGFGVESSKELSVANAKEFIEALMAMVKGGDFVPRSAPSLSTTAVHEPTRYAVSNDTATFAQQAKIRHLWNKVSRAPEKERERALNNFLHNRFEISFLNWLPRERVGKVIYTLQAMIKQKEGVEDA